MSHYHTIYIHHNNTNYYCRAAHEKWGDSIREYQCVDVSQDMNDLAEYLLRGTNIVLF